MTQRLSTSIASLARGPILVLSMFNCGFAAAQQPLAQRVQRIDACFQEAIRARAVDEPVLSRVRSSDEAVFLSERLARDISYDDKLNGWRGQAIDEAPEDYCKRAASDFVKAVLKALEGQPADGLAQMGTLSIASECTVVESYQNLIGRHHRGQSDISQAATLQRRWGPQAQNLFASASQSPDLYRWNDERYHAHTGDVSGATRPARSARIEESKASTRALFVLLLRTVRERSAQSDTKGSIVALGIAAHLVQDLVFHRGMTLAQHAGLSFVKNRNPDLLPPPIGPERMDEAVRRTVWLLAIAEELVGANAWERMRLWTPDGSFDLKLEISAVYGRGGGASGEDISTSALFAFWALAGEYRSGKRPMSELDETPRESEQGVVCWNVDATLAGWRTALN